jgi:hypothetical protein
MLEIYFGDLLTQHELDTKLAILLTRAQTQAIAGHRPEQETFGEVRSLIRGFRFGAGEQDLALKARVSQARCGGVPRGTTADDHCFLCNSRTRSSDQARYPPRTAIANA